MTIINHTYKFVFVHVPKAGGTSVASVLSELSLYSDQEIGGTPLGEAIAPLFRARFGIAKHSTMLEIRKAIGSETAQAYTKFAVVRNPYDRARSCFRFLRRWRGWRELPRYGHFAGEFDSCATINDFVRSRLFEQPGPDRIFNPQVSWLAGANDGQLMVDDVLHLETIDRDLPTLLRRLGAPEDVAARDVPKVNVSSRQRDRDEMDVDCVARLKERYADDFLKLGYPDIPVAT